MSFPSDQYQRAVILLLAASPERLRLDIELDKIYKAIQRSARRQLFELKLRMAVQPSEIRRAIAEEKPHIVHFCGHGLPGGYLLVEDDDTRKELKLHPKALAMLFKPYKDQVFCVILNACFSETTADEIARHIPFAIGMNREIKDQTAISFAEGFYDVLGRDSKEGINFEKAFDEGKIAVALRRYDEVETPVLKKRKGYLPPFRILSSDPILVQPETIPLLDLKYPQELEVTTITGIDERTVSSSNSIQGDYTKLEDLLKQQQWRQADLETMDIILKLCNREKQKWLLEKKNIKLFPCPDLQHIDQLWMKYSQDQFGLTAQRECWEIAEKNHLEEEMPLTKFGDLVGWRKEEKWLKNYNDFNFTQQAQKGHLPSWRMPGAEEKPERLGLWHSCFKAFLNRYQHC